MLVDPPAERLFVVSKPMKEPKAAALLPNSVSDIAPPNPNGSVVDTAAVAGAAAEYDHDKDYLDNIARLDVWGVFNLAAAADVNRSHTMSVVETSAAADTMLNLSQSQSTNDRAVPPPEIAMTPLMLPSAAVAAAAPASAAAAVAAVADAAAPVAFGDSDPSVLTSVVSTFKYITPFEAVELPGPDPSAAKQLPGKKAQHRPFGLPTQASGWAAHVRPNPVKVYTDLIDAFSSERKRVSSRFRETSNLLSDAEEDLVAEYNLRMEVRGKPELQRKAFRPRMILGRFMCLDGHFFNNVVVKSIQVCFPFNSDTVAIFADVISFLVGPLPRPIVSKLHKANVNFTPKEYGIQVSDERRFVSSNNASLVMEACHLSQRLGAEIPYFRCLHEFRIVRAQHDLAAVHLEELDKYVEYKCAPVLPDGRKKKITDGQRSVGELFERRREIEDRIKMQRGLLASLLVEEDYLIENSPHFGGADKLESVVEARKAAEAAAVKAAAAAAKADAGASSSSAAAAAAVPMAAGDGDNDDDSGDVIDAPDDVEERADAITRSDVLIQAKANMAKAKTSGKPNPFSKWMDAPWSEDVEKFTAELDAADKAVGRLALQPKVDAYLEKRAAELAAEAKQAADAATAAAAASAPLTPSLPLPSPFLSADRAGPFVYSASASAIFLPSPLSVPPPTPVAPLSQIVPFTPLAPLTPTTGAQPLLSFSQADVASALVSSANDHALSVMSANFCPFCEKCMTNPGMGCPCQRAKVHIAGISSLVSSIPASASAAAVAAAVVPSTPAVFAEPLPMPPRVRASAAAAAPSAVKVEDSDRTRAATSRGPKPSPTPAPEVKAKRKFDDVVFDLTADDDDDDGTDCVIVEIKKPRPSSK